MKEPLYNEDAVNERMDIIGRNGNLGYEEDDWNAPVNPKNNFELINHDGSVIVKGDALQIVKHLLNHLKTKN